MNRIADYALVGDCHSAALVGRDASVDWACFPRFDSAAVFCRMLDERRGGSFDISCGETHEVTRGYLDDSCVLETTMTCADGRLAITDCMPVEPLDDARPAAVTARHSILRRLRCLEGAVTVEVSIAPRFDYGRFVPRFRLTSEETAEIVGGSDAIWVSATRGLTEHGDRISARWRLRAGEQVFVEAAWSPSFELRMERASEATFERRLDDTLAFWRRWSDRCWYAGSHAAAVKRSAATLKALSFAPTGAIVAAPTTSLPEEIGGIRNWDYRYTWIRDATLTLISLFSLGYKEEADAFKLWLERTGAGRPEDLQIMYGIGGERSLPEMVLDHLEGHRGSAPVRVGNGAVKQLQLDAFGQLCEAAYLYGKAGGAITPDNWNFLCGIAETTVRRWREPDQGIWEMRDAPRHFVHSKLNCWVALDRVVRIAEARRLPAPVARWRAERDQIASALLADARERGYFSQAIGTDAADAAALLVPAMGLLPSTDPLVQKTIEVVRDELADGGLVHRYRATDGLEGGEGAFLLCSFWLADALTHSGRVEEAEAVLDEVVSCANDVGLWSEEVEPATKQALGNMPQAFTHMAFITSAMNLEAAKGGGIDPQEVHDYAELAVDRLLAQGRELAHRVSTRPPSAP